MPITDMKTVILNVINKVARGYVALANTYAGFYMMCISLHTMEHVMGSFHDNLVHGAGLIMLSRQFFNYFIEHNAGEESFVKMAKAMGVENAKSSKDFLTAFDKLLKSIDCDNLKMSENMVKRIQELANKKQGHYNKWLKEHHEN